MLATGTETAERDGAEPGEATGEPTEAPLLPDAHWLLGHMPERASATNSDMLALMLRAQSHGGLMRMRFAYKRAYVLSDPAHIKHVLTSPQGLYRKDTRGYKKLRLFLGNGLVTSDGDFWLRQRRIAQPAFHKKCIATFAERMGAATLDTARDWQARVESGEPLDIATEMNRLTLRIAGETLFSTDISAESDAIGANLQLILHRFSEIISAPIPYPELWPTRKNLEVWRARREMFAVIEGIIATRRESGEQIPDLLGMLMAARDEETGEGMTDLQLRDEALTMLMAGHETTANALAFAFYLLSRHPEIARKVEQEVDAVLGDDAPSMEDTRKLVYTGQVLHEAMRLYPPVWAIGRVPSEDDVIGGHRIPKGSFIFISQWGMHRHPDHWVRPEAFDPDRWHPDQPKPDRFVYFPFSRGQRQCIGDRFAEMEALIVLAMLVRRFRFAEIPGFELDLEPSVTLRPRNGLPMRVSARPSEGQG